MEARLDIPLLLRLLLLRLRLLLQVELLEFEVAHLVVILVRHREPGVTKQLLRGWALRWLPLQNGE